MKISKEKALILWESRYGDHEVIEDFAGAWIYKEDYLDGETLREFYGDEESYNFGWGILYKKPLKFGGTETDDNLEIVHLENLEVIGEQKVFNINGITYEIKEIGHETFGIFDEYDNRFDFNEDSFMLGFDQFDEEEQGCGCGGHHHHHDEEQGCGCGGHHHHHDEEEQGCGCGGHHHHHDDEEQGCGCGRHHHHHDDEEETCDCGNKLEDCECKQ